MNSLARQAFTENAERKPASQQRTPARRYQAHEFLPGGGMLQRKPSCACGGGCPRCQAAASNLKISEPDDAYEREADAVADKVMRMAEPDVRIASAASAIQRKCTDCAKEYDEGRMVQTKAELSRLSNSAKEGAFSAPASVTDGLNSSAQSLDLESLAFFETRFGRDFGNVRVHTDGKAAESAKAIQARAYTVGQDVVFAAAQYAPQSEEGRRLLAHELTHVAQQNGGVSGLADNHGLEAPAVQQTIMRTSELVIQREETEDEEAQAPAEETENAEAQESTQHICGPDITSSLTTMLGTIEPWFRGLTGFQQSRSCMALGPGAPLVGVNPIMAWDTRELFLPNTGWLDAYFRRRSCGSPRDSRCDTDPTRNLCETAGSCGNSVVVDGKCMLAGTANYALFGKMCRLCHDSTGRWNRWDMRAIIGAYKTIAGDDSTPPKEMASAAYDGTFPTAPATTENRRTCTGRCELTHGGAFDFIWEPYKPR
jgi:hypothetical protein